MNILILTSSMIESDFDLYQDMAHVKLNPSNQIFYNKLIKALAKYNNVAVVSHRPVAKNMFKSASLDQERSVYQNIKYFYTSIKQSILYKVFDETNEIIKTSKFAIDSYLSKNFVVVVDSLRYGLVKAALKLSKIYNAKVVGVLTDNPKNLSKTNFLYANKLVGKVSKFHAYLSLTKPLADEINKDKPQYIFEGLVSNEEGDKIDRISNYFFFAGSLYERYGVKALVDAFHLSLCTSKLVIAGNGPLSSYIDELSKTDPRILFLSQIKKSEVIGYELKAVANINPRPINKELDEKSVPSKLIEYLSIGVPTISTKYEGLYHLFEDDVFWVEDNTQKSLTESLEKFEKTSDALKIKKASSAKAKAFEMYSLDVQGELITHFLINLNK